MLCYIFTWEDGDLPRYGHLPHARHHHGQSHVEVPSFLPEPFLGLSIPLQKGYME